MLAAFNAYIPLKSNVKGEPLSPGMKKVLDFRGHLIHHKLRRIAIVLLMAWKNLYKPCARLRLYAYMYHLMMFGALMEFCVQPSEKKYIVLKEEGEYIEFKVGGEFGETIQQIMVHCIILVELTLTPANPCEVCHST